MGANEENSAIDRWRHGDDVGGEEDIANLFAEQVPDDSHPLMVCKVAFWVGGHKGSTESLLMLDVGDLVRVTSLLNSEMLFGFFDGKSEKRGWFQVSASGCWRRMLGTLRTLRLLTRLRRCLRSPSAFADGSGDKPVAVI